MNINIRGMIRYIITINYNNNFSRYLVDKTKLTKSSMNRSELCSFIKLTK